VRQRSPKPPEAHCSQTPAPFNPLYEAGDYAEAADRSRGAIEAYPEVAGAFFCIECCEALAGRADDARVISGMRSSGRSDGGASHAGTPISTRFATGPR
jgi:hypothetical protein